MKKTPKISIIIPLYVIEERFFKDLKKFEKLDYPNYEIIVVSDKKVEIKEPKVRLVITGKRRTGPAEKRDLGLKHANGKICAFIDDDAYPAKSWLKEVVKSLQKPGVVAVGGPGITPKGDDFFSRLGGLVYESVLTSGKAQDRFVRKRIRRYVKDWPAYNLSVKRDILKRVGGYGSSFYGGEDTFLCLKLIKYGKIVYNSKAFVYHHRRPLFLPHMRQIFNVGVHRGYFAKAFPETSRKFFYFIPSILIIGFFGLLVLSFLNSAVAGVFVIVFSLFFLAAFLSVAGKIHLFGTFLAGAGIIATHLTYGIGFIQGLLTKELKR